MQTSQNLRTGWTPLQGELSKLQIVPLIGPFFISPYKMAVSSAEITSGATKKIVASAKLTFTSYIYLMPNNNQTIRLANSGTKEMVEGCFQFAYALSNTTTLGIASWVIEGLKALTPANSSNDYNNEEH